MKRPELPGKAANNDREMTVYNNTNEELYSVLFFTTTGSAQTTVKSFEGVGKEGLRDGIAAWLAPRRKVQRHHQGIAPEFEREADYQNAQAGRRSARLLLLDGPLEDSPGTDG